MWLSGCSVRYRNYQLTEKWLSQLLSESRGEQLTERERRTEDMANTAAEETAPISNQQLCGVCSGALSGDKPAACSHSVCGSCLKDKSKGCPECLQSPGKPEPDSPKQNGTEAEAPVIESKEEPDSKTTEETKIQEDLKESEDPKKPGEEKKEAEEVKKEAEEVKEEEVKEEPLGPDDVVCDSCIENPRRALKSCLTCLVSYCEAHLRPHLENTKFQNHRLVEPLRDIERRTCESHKWPLELFCSADSCCVCQDCVTEEHKGHSIVPVVEARSRIEVRAIHSHTRFIYFHYNSSKLHVYASKSIKYTFFLYN